MLHCCGMPETDPRIRDCAAEAGYQAIEFLQEKWVLHIVRSLLTGAKGFNALSREVGGCNPTTLTQRLARPESLELLRRGSLPERGFYELTPSGQALGAAIDAIEGWAEQHLTTPEIAHLYRHWQREQGSDASGRPA